MANDTDKFCQSAKVYKCVSGNPGLWTSGLTESVTSTFFTLFIIYLAFVGSFTFAGQNTVGKMFSAASKTIRGKSAKTPAYAELRNTYGPSSAYRRYNKTYVPDGVSWFWFLTPMLLILLIAHTNNFKMSVLEPIFVFGFLILLILGRSDEHVNMTSRSVIGGITTGLLMTMFWGIWWNITHINTSDSPFVILMYMICFWCVVTFLAWFQKAARREGIKKDIDAEERKDLLDLMKQLQAQQNQQAQQ